MTADKDTQDGVLTAIRAHHDQLSRTVSDHALTISRSIDRLTSPAVRRDVLVDFCRQEVLPHAMAEEETVYRVAADLPRTRLLAQAMHDEHVTLRELAADLAAAGTPAEIAAAATALNAIFQSHLEKENEVLLPALASAGVDLAALLKGMHEVLGREPGEEERKQEPEPGESPELDVRRLIPAQRHEQIFKAFAELTAAAAFVLVNDHDPKPLYYQFAAEHPGEFTWDYLESGPEVWRVRIGRP
ncbi:DUF2249 domain-containing protein [Nonomuraea sp. NPDC049649]|uniref:DUF2249 domain-containing protein n=1 Tax=Nonomuraea sp. NPDC049649 TaxID=3155776 RepID=UPI00341BD3C7